MRTPCVDQLPLAILLIPYLHPMIRRGRDYAVSVEIELGHRDQVLMSGVEVGEPGHFCFLFPFLAPMLHNGPIVRESIPVTCEVSNRLFHIHSSAPGNASFSCMNEAGSHEAREPRPLM